MTTKLKVYVNEDDALLFWSIPKPIPGCRGFAIQRRIKRKGKKQTEDFLLNRTGFENQKVSANGNGKNPNVRPSTEWPFQRFSWTDHDAQTGDTVSYRVIPMIRNSAGDLEQKESDASAWSPKRTLGTTKGEFKPFFNRGFVMSQFMARFLKENNLTLKQFKGRISDKDDKTIRRFLSGDLRLALLAELQTALKEGGKVFAALFELSDPELIGALAKLKDKANVVLANGSVQKAKGETSADARRRDENEAARQ